MTTNDLKKLNFRADKCLVCKLFTAPLMFTMGGYFAFRNRELWLDSAQLKHKMTTDKLPQMRISVH